MEESDIGIDQNDASMISEQKNQEDMISQRSMASSMNLSSEFDPDQLRDGGKSQKDIDKLVRIILQIRKIKTVNFLRSYKMM